jgi:patatin-like phospholipase
MANSTSTPEQSKNTADPPSEPKPYIEPVPYENLIKANKNREIDTQSNKIIEREEGYVRRWRSASGAGRSQHNVRDTLAGLALSGGGIRSATFALGVSQALAAKDKMRRFDYLSTVSGGGYFGSSLTWLTRADNQPASDCFRFGMDSEHFPYPVDPPGQQTHRRADPAQDKQLIYLRQHGKYLAPGRGIDLVSGIAVVVARFSAQPPRLAADRRPAAPRAAGRFAARYVLPAAHFRRPLLSEWLRVDGRGRRARQRRIHLCLGALLLDDLPKCGRASVALSRPALLRIQNPLRPVVHRCHGLGRAAAVCQGGN